MQRRLWHYNTTKVERKRKIFGIDDLALILGGGALMGGAGWLGSQANKKKDEGQFSSYTAPMTPEQQQLYNWGYGQMTGGFPELDQAYNTQWGDFRRGLSEEYQAKKGFQPLGTPEISQMAQARATGQANLAGTKLNAQQNLYNMLRGLVRQPTTTYTPAGPSGMENLLSFGAPVASTALSGYMQNQTWKDIMSQGAKNAAPKFTPYEETGGYDKYSQLLPYLAMMGGI